MSGLLLQAEGQVMAAQNLPMSDEIPAVVRHNVQTNS